MAPCAQRISEGKEGDTLVGTWALSGMNLAGVTMFGDKAALSELAGGDDMTIVLESGGTGKAFGEAITWTVSPSGAVITSPDGALPVKALGNDIIIDASGATGSLDFGGASILFLFSK